MLVVKIGILFSLICVSASHKEHTPISKSCHEGHVAENECNKCICSADQIFECIPKPCNNTGIPIPKEKLSCHPNVLYVRNSTVCLCNDNGYWPHANCETIFKSFSKTTKQGCEPNSYVIIDCNVCKCGPDGNIDKNHCTKNACNETEKNETRRFINLNQVYGSCEAKNWYSLAPCQFCFCVRENRLVCNTGHNYAKQLQLGSYNLSICSKDLIKDAISLVPDWEIASMRFGKKIESLIDLSNREVKTSIKSTNYENHVNNDEEYYSDSEEVTARIPVGKDGLWKPSPYKEDNYYAPVKSDNDVTMSVPIDTQSSQSLQEPTSEHLQLSPPKHFQPWPLEPTQEPSQEPSQKHLLQIPRESVAKQSISDTKQKDFPQNFAWTNPENTFSIMGNTGTKDSFRLGDLLKPYLPVVLGQVFQMALRKSMVSVEPNTNCTPGSTNVLKCNACFCMKNNKLLCTSRNCNKLNAP